MTDYKNKKLWVVSDVDEKAKDKAKKLAKLDKKKIGQWLSEFILNINTQSVLDIAGQIDSSNDVRKIMNSLDKINIEINDIHVELSYLAGKHPSEKKTFFDKFFK